LISEVVVAGASVRVGVAVTVRLGGRGVPDVVVGVPVARPFARGEASSGGT
jgi:hypothetical protein